MKMQNALHAEFDCVVKKILVKPGSTVAVEQVLIEFEKKEEEAPAADAKKTKSKKQKQ
jgi:pyruvate/2-oxoglutarate dehydrogenase complex dihydrolipoamide acyltransferase (E2) component